MSFFKNVLVNFEKIENRYNKSKNLKIESNIEIEKNENRIENRDQKIRNSNRKSKNFGIGRSLLSVCSV